MRKIETHGQTDRERKGRDRESALLSRYVNENGEQCQNTLRVGREFYSTDPSRFSFSKVRPKRKGRNAAQRRKKRKNKYGSIHVSCVAGRLGRWLRPP